MAALAEVSRHAYCARFAYPAAYLNPRRHQLVGAALQYLLAQQGGAQIFALQILAFYSRCGCGWGGLTIPLLTAFHITEHKFCLGLVGRSSPPRVDRQGMCQRVKIRRGVRVSG